LAWIQAAYDKEMAEANAADINLTNARRGTVVNPEGGRMREKIRRVSQYNQLKVFQVLDS